MKMEAKCKNKLLAKSFVLQGKINCLQSEDTSLGLN